MDRIFHFSSPREPYVCDAAVVWCYDFRFDAAFRKLLKRIGIFCSDPVRIAGGAKCLVSPGYEGDRQFVLNQIRISMNLHSAKTAILMLHSDCGAYGGSAAFDSDAEREALHHTSDLKKAAAFLKNQIPELTVKAYFLDFEGAWEVEVESVAYEVHP